MPQFTKEVEEAIAWFAAEFKYLKELHAALEKIKQEKATQQRKELKAALKVARYVGKAERRAEKPLQDILSILSRIPDTTLHKTLKEMEIPERKLIREGSFYVGSLRKGLKHARTNISIYENYPSGSLEQKIQVEISKLRVEVEELETWVAALERGLQAVESWLQQNVPGISRRKLMKAVAAGAALGALSPLKAFAGKDVEAKIRALPLRKDFEYEDSLKKYLAEKGTYDYARRMSEIELPENDRLSMFDVHIYWHYKRRLWFVQELLKLGFSKSEMIDYATNTQDEKWLVVYAGTISKIKTAGEKAFTPRNIITLARIPALAATVRDLVILFSSGKKTITYLEFGGTLEYARALQKEGFDADTIYQSALFGMKKENIGSFRDTGRPNALIVTATGEKDINPSSIARVVRKVMGEYDTLIRVVSTVSDVRNAIDEVYRAGGQETFKLLIIVAHGNPEAITLGSDQKNPETLITKETRFKDDFAKLAPDAVIFLIACSAGDGKDLKRNIANHLLLEATDVRRGIVKRVVYAAQTFMSPKKITIKSVYPFDVVTHGLFYLDKEGNKIPIYELKDRILHTFRQDLFTEDNTYRATLTQGIWLRG